MRPDFLDVAGSFTSLTAAQAALDAWVSHYNRERPHQALDDQQPVTPAQRFEPAPDEQRSLLELWLPAALDLAPQPAFEVAVPEAITPEPTPAWAGGPVEFDRMVPPSGNMIVCQRQFWMGTRRAGMVARIWADCDLIHVLIGGARVPKANAYAE